jgi:alcohol dehydrogenase YqhD (iron-dependent ADH family)
MKGIYKIVLPKELHTLIEVGPKVVEDPTKYELASNFMWSCTMALNGLIQKEFLLIGQHI